jgi:hypothetical protein
MKRTLYLLVTLIGAYQLTGCSVISAVATSSRMEEARAANVGKQLIPKDGGTYLIAVGMETASYLGTGSTDWKINSTSFSQPKGTYSLITVAPGTYTVYGNKRVAGGGEATSSVEVKSSESVCFYVVNPLTTPARLETFKNDACEPMLRPLRNQNIVEKLQ